VVTKPLFASKIIENEPKNPRQVNAEARKNENGDAAKNEDDGEKEDVAQRVRVT